MEVNEKCDVYSFGVVVLEVIQGRHPGDLVSTLLSRSSGSSVEQQQCCEIKDVVDDRIPKPTGCALGNIMFMMNVAAACLNVKPEYRPSMQQVSRRLSCSCTIMEGVELEQIFTS